jgi:hypothetical protein
VNAAEFLQKFKRQPVAVGANGSGYHLVPLSRYDIRDILAKPTDAEQVALTLARSITDGTGSRLFADEQIDQLGTLLSVDQQDIIYAEISRLNKFRANEGKAHTPETPN